MNELVETLKEEINKKEIKEPKKRGRKPRKVEEK